MVAKFGGISIGCPTLTSSGSPARLPPISAPLFFASFAPKWREEKDTTWPPPAVAVPKPLSAMLMPPITLRKWFSLSIFAHSSNPVLLPFPTLSDI